MKIIITGSLGHISKPLAKELVQKGHTVTVISSNPDKQKDIEAAISEELTTTVKGRKVRYVASEELSCSQIANILGTAVGKPYLKWVTISDKQMLDALLKYKMPLSLANDITEMNASQRNGGILFEDYYKNIPAMGKVKMKDFAQEFAAVYNSK